MAALYYSTFIPAWFARYLFLLFYILLLYMLRLVILLCLIRL